LGYIFIAINLNSLADEVENKEQNKGFKDCNQLAVLLALYSDCSTGFCSYGIEQMLATWFGCKDKGIWVSKANYTSSFVDLTS